MAYVHQPQQRPTRYTGCEKYDHIACRSPSDISLWLHVKNGKIYRTGLGSFKDSWFPVHVLVIGPTLASGHARDRRICENVQECLVCPDSE